MADLLFCLRDIGKVYGKGDTAAWALRDVHLDVQRGEWLSVTGRSGTGKSTLLSIVGLLERPTTGAYTFNGMDVGALGASATARLRNRNVGFIFQSYHLSPALRAVENVELPLLYRGFTVQEARVRARQVMERLGVADLADRLPGRMSGGQQQRVAICRALVGEPDLILADEPTGNLDSTWAAGIADLLALANRGGATLLVATHDPWLASKAHRRAHLVDGCITSS